MSWSHSKKKKRVDKSTNSVRSVYPDNDLCKTPGLNNCINSGEVANLVCFALIWVFEFED